MESVIERPLQVLVAFAFALPRLLAMFTMIPVLTRQSLPGILRTCVALAFGMLLVPGLLSHEGLADFGLVEGLFIVAKEVFIGAALGFAAAVPIWAFDAMGSFVDNQRGASIAQTVNPMTGHDSSPLGELFSQAAVAYLAATGGMLLLLDATYRSFELWPVFEAWPMLNDQAPRLMLEQLDRLLRLAVLLGAPVFVSMLLCELGLALVSRFVPQLQVFFLAMSIKSALAMFVFAAYAVTLMDQGGQLINDHDAALQWVQSLFSSGGSR